MIAEIFNVLYNDGAVSKMKKAQASQYAENVYFLKPCGLMDQSAISLGGVSMIDFENVENPFVLGVQYPFTDTDIVITNTGGNHADLTSDYAAIRAEMEEVSEKFSEKYLRLVDYQKFLDAIPALQNEVSGRAIMRAIHFFDENLRVDKAVSAINMKRRRFLQNRGRKRRQQFQTSAKLLRSCGYGSAHTFGYRTFATRHGRESGARARRRLCRDDYRICRKGGNARIRRAYERSFRRGARL
ncbi:MAG: hypothetical protein L6V82_06615 [Clostridiales bacterium]|nr:MAG: hypothetical protein L6V82_06615 [Clostridiales bacterium]